MADNPTTLSEDMIYDLAIYDQTLFVARQTGLYRSTDNGINWQNISHSWVPDTEIPSLTVCLSPNFASDHTLIAGINGGIALSDDAGDTWEIHHFRNPIPMVTCLGISPNFKIDHTIFAGTYEDGMFRSVDAGKTWQAFNFGLFDHNIFCIAISPNFAEDQTVYVGTSSGIYKSLNGGRLWHDVALPVDHDVILSLALGDGGQMFAGTENNGLLISQDKGLTWIVGYGSDSVINSLLLLPDKNTLIAQMDDRVMSSESNGATWTPLIEGDVHAITLDHNKQSILAGLADTTIQFVNVSNSS